MAKAKAEKPKYNVILWSGGKDSTATVILAHQLGIKIDLILMSRMWFDKKRGIPAENQKHLDWVDGYAKPLFESWGNKVEFVSSDKDYMYWFYKVRQSSKMHPETIGKYYGFVIGGNCKMQGEKTIPAQRRLRELKKDYDVVEYCGICFDEDERIERMKSRKGQLSLLVEQHITQFDSRRICEEHGLLSPDYTKSRKRAGNCWFCPNQKLCELAELKTEQPALYHELEILSQEKNTVARGFCYGETFESIDARVDAYIANPPPKQLTIFDMFDNV